MQQAGGTAAHSGPARPMSAAGRAAAERARKRRQAGAGAEDLRAEGEDDDGYDPYSDYMDRLAREGGEEP